MLFELSTFLALASGLDVSVTFNVRGSVYPVDEFGSECTAARLSDAPCSCFGGASRRATVLQSDSSAITIDTGNYLRGRGLFSYALPDVSPSLLSNYTVAGGDVTIFAFGDLTVASCNSLLSTSNATHQRNLAQYFEQENIEDGDVVIAFVDYLEDDETAMDLVNMFPAIDLLLTTTAFTLGGGGEGEDLVVTNNSAGRPVSIARIESGGEWVTTLSDNFTRRTATYLDCSVPDSFSMDGWKAAVDDWLDNSTPVGYVNASIDNDTLAAIAATAIRWYASAEVAILPNDNLDARRLVQGPNGMRNILDALSDTGAEVVVAYLDEDQLSELLAEDDVVSTPFAFKQQNWDGQDRQERGTFRVASSTRILPDGSPVGGVSPFYAFAEYLSEFHGSPSSALLTDDSVEQDNTQSSSSSSSRENSGASSMMIVVVVVAFAVACVGCSCILAAARSRLISLRRSRNQAEERARILAAMNVHTVVTPFHPELSEERKTRVLICKSGARSSSVVSGYGEPVELGGDFIVSSIKDQPTSTLLYEADDDEEDRNSNTYHLDMWYWEESTDRVDIDRNVFLVPDDEDPRTWWVAYDDLVQDQISEVYQRFKRLPLARQLHIRRQCESSSQGIDEDSDKSLYSVVIQPTQQPSSSDSMLYHYHAPPPIAAAGRDSSSSSSDRDIIVLDPPIGREINVATMTQRNLLTGKTRRIRVEPHARIVRLQFYWREHVRQMAKWRSDRKSTIEGTLWVRYQDPEVQRRLAQLYLTTMHDDASPDTLFLDSYNECARHADDAKYEVNLKSMFQTRLDSGFRRAVSVLIDTEYVKNRAAAVSGGTLNEDEEGEDVRRRVVRGLPSVKNMPLDIQAEPCLALDNSGDMVSVLYEHEQGDWAFGKEIVTNDRFDTVSESIELPPTPDSAISGGGEPVRSRYFPRSGWFPLRNVQALDAEETDAAGIPTETIRDFRFLLPPEGWHDIDVLGEAEPILVPASPQERRELTELIDTSKFAFVDATRLENIRLWRPYAARRKYVADKLAGDDVEVERYPLLFKCAYSEGNAVRIATDGFSANDLVDDYLGKGLYLDTDIEDSLATQNDVFVVVCRAIVGRSCLGLPGALAPPHRHDMSTLRFDSTANRLEDPTELAVFDWKCIYPTFILQLRRISPVAGP